MGGKATGVAGKVRQVVQVLLRPLRQRTAVAGLATLLLLPAFPAAADDNPFDDPFLSSRLSKALEFQRSGASATWWNGDTGASGTIKILRTYFLAPAKPCRDYLLTVQGAQEEATARQGTACRNESGVWHQGDGTALPMGQDEAARPVQAESGEQADQAPDLAAWEGVTGELPPPTCGLQAKVETSLAFGARKTSDASDSGEVVTALDLVLVIDMTGSMKSEVESFKTGFFSTVRVLKEIFPELNIGIVAYKDRTDEYLTRSFQLVPMNNINQMRVDHFLKPLRTGGGGDTPEPVASALSAAAMMNWRSSAIGWIVVIGDAPSHRRDWDSAFSIAGRFCRDGLAQGTQRRVSAVFAGQRRSGWRARQFFERLALHGGGEMIAHQGVMIESLLLSVLPKRSS